VIRVIRLIRLTRIAKLYKNAKQAMHHQSEGAVMDDSDFVIPSELRVGKKLSDITTKRVIALVLGMLLMLPLFEVDMYHSHMYSWEFGVDALGEFVGTTGYLIARDEYIRYHEDRRRPIVHLEQDWDDWEWTASDTDDDDLRLLEKHVVESDGVTACFDLRADTRLEAGLNIAKTVFVCIVLALGAIFFTKDANDLVLIPIERMIDRVKRLAKNPLANFDEDDSSVVDIYKLEKQSSNSGGIK
jgi:hypothetical protein